MWFTRIFLKKGMIEKIETWFFTEKDKTPHKVPRKNSTRRSTGFTEPTSLTRLPVTFGPKMKNAVIDIGWVRLSPQKWPKIAPVAAK